MPSRMIYLLKLSVDSSELKKELQHKLTDVSAHYNGPQVFLENRDAFGRQKCKKKRRTFYERLSASIKSESLPRAQRDASEKITFTVRERLDGYVFWHATSFDRESNIS